MLFGDAINGLFELSASGFILNHCRVLFLQKKVRGISILSSTFFFLWGLWNIIYYPSLGQTFSFLAGLSVAAANALWVGMMLHYRSKESSC